jgi:hypothetical protein
MVFIEYILFLFAELAKPSSSPRIFVSALQARNNARVVIAGSLAMFADASVEQNRYRFRRVSRNTSTVF